MNGQPSPYSGESELAKDARRFQAVLVLSRIEVDVMRPQERAVWERLVRGGWYTEDLVAGLDALIAEDKKQRGGYAGAEQE